YAFPGTELFRHTNDFVPLGPAAEGAKLIKWQKELSDLDTSFRNLTNEKAALERRAKTSKDGLPAGSDDAKTAKAERTVTEVNGELAEVRLKISDLEQHPPSIEKAYGVSEGKAADARIQIKGDPKKLGDEVPRGFLQILGGQRLQAAEKGSGRLELAQWIADPK